MGERVRAHQHGEFGEILLRHAVFVHVAGGDEAVIGGNRRTERHLVVGMADLRQCGGLAHEVERGRALMLAVGCEANAGDEAHGAAPKLAVIPGQRVSVEPGIHNHGWGLWIPGPRLTARPGMTTWRDLRAYA